MAILNDKAQIAKAVNATVIPMEEAPKGYQDFGKGAARKFILNPHGMIPNLSACNDLVNFLISIIAPSDD
jgi:hypothetical protein